ncbi:Cytochrome P450 714B1-like protein [Drosera capensis]
MEFLEGLWLAMVALVCSMIGKLLYECYLVPKRVYRRLRPNGFQGPDPTFPLGNLKEMKRRTIEVRSSVDGRDHGSSERIVCHDIHASALPYFAHWQKLHGEKGFHILDGNRAICVHSRARVPQGSLRAGTSKAMGKACVFRSDRIPMFGEFGLNMIEGHAWVHHRHITTPAFSPGNLKGMVTLMVESRKKMIDHWNSTVTIPGETSMDVEKEITALAGENIAKTNFGLNDEA